MATGDAAATLAVALGVGLLLGLERERRRPRGPDRGPAGVRTFALVALFGGLCARVGGAAALAVGAAFVGLAVIAGYLRSADEDPGLTTEVALLIAFMLGALAQADSALAAGAGVAVAIVLAARSWLHILVRETLTEQEVHDGLLFAAAALIVLPLVPDRGIGPGDAFNPAVVWRLVVLVMGIGAVGYVAQRVIGPRFGLPLAGFIGGFVSSTATIGSMGARAAREPAMRQGAVAAGVNSTVATVVLLAAVVGAIDRAALGAVTLPCVLAGIAAVAYAAVFSVRATRADQPPDLELGRAFDLRTAIGLAAAISALLLVATGLQHAAGDAGLLVATAVAGFADAQTAGATAAALVVQGRVSPSAAAVAILVGLTTNTVSKAGVAVGLGGWRYAAAIWPGLAMVVGTAWLGLLVDRGL